VTNEQIAKRFLFELNMGMYRICRDGLICFKSNYKNPRKYIIKLTKLLKDYSEYVEFLPPEIEEHYKTYSNYIASNRVLIINTNVKKFHHESYEPWFTRNRDNIIPDYIVKYDHRLEVKNND